MPTENQSKRKLAAILFADIVGYTALMQTDEKEGNALLDKFLNTINQEIIQFNGQVINNYGDGCVCIFESAVLAIQFAKAIQTTFQSEPEVPVRIGLHSGDVFFKEDNVFGDSVNIASRIESMGVPGSVLVSKRIRDVVKNQADLLLPSLGLFEFKNVEEPMEVFALANEGFVVPEKNEMKGKFKEKVQLKRKNYVGYLLAVGVLAICAWIWLKNNASDSLKINSTEQFEPNKTPLSKADRDKRVAVMVFENKTGDEYLEDFGTMISDWITKGLMEIGEANVISAANIQTQIAKAGIGGSSMEHLSESTGIGLILQGRYYLQEDQLIIHANVVDTKKGEVIHALDPIQGPKDKMLDLLDQLTDEILGYWTIKSNTRFLQNPPKYEAYQKYITADRIWNEGEFEDLVEKNLLESIELDPNFVEAKIKYAVFNGNSQRNLRKKDSLLNQMEQGEYSFTKWEELRFNSVMAAHKMQWEKAAELCEKMFEMDESYVSAAYNAGNYYVRANMPDGAMAILNRIDNRFRQLEEQDYSWIELRRIEALYMGEQYRKVLKEIRNYPFPKMIASSAGLHLSTLIRMDSLAVLQKVLDKYVNTGVLTFNGNPATPDELWIQICREMYLLNKNDLLAKYTEELKNWTLDHPEAEDYSYNLGLVAFFSGDLRSTIDQLKKINANRFFPFLEAQSIIGYCQAQLKNKNAALQTISLINEYEIENQKSKTPNALRSVFSEYVKARIYHALGQNDVAINHAEQSKRNGAWFYPGTLWKYDIFLKDLQDEPAFQELITPKG